MRLTRTRDSRRGIVDFVLFLSILLIGSDRLSITVGGMTIRAVQALLLLLFLLLHLELKYNVSFVIVVGFAFFFIGHLLSLVNSYDAPRTIAYLIWTVYNLFFVLLVFYNVALYWDIDYLLRIYRACFRFHVVLLVLNIAIGLAGIYSLPFFYVFKTGAVVRPSIWFYEPSYLATFLMF